MKTLSKRELEIINLIIEGLTAKEIADQLGISKRTVEAHNDNIRMKLDAKNQGQVVAICYQQGILTIQN